MSRAVIVLIFIELESIALLLYSIVSQVHEQVIYVLRVLTGWFELFRCEASETLLVNEYTQGVHSIDQGVDSQIKL